MLFLAGLFNRSSLSFIFVSAVRLLSIVACLLGFAAEIFILVEAVKGVHAAEAHPTPAKHPAGNSTTTAVLAATSTDTCGYIGYSDVPKSFGGLVFFTVAQVQGIVILLMCLISEVAPPKSPEFFEYVLPVLGQNFGVGFVGVLQAFTASIVLSRNSSVFPTVAAWFLIVIGLLNMLLGISWGERIRAKRSIFEAGKTYAKKATRYDDVEKGVRLGKKGFDLGKKAFEAGKGAKVNGKKVNISAPTAPTYDGQPVRVFNGAFEVPPTAGAPAAV